MSWTKKKNLKRSVSRVNRQYAHISVLEVWYDTYEILTVLERSTGSVVNVFFKKLMLVINFIHENGQVSIEE